MTWLPEVAIRPELEEGETIRWLGQPSYGAVASGTAFMVLIGLLMVGFAITFITFAASDGAGLLFEIFPLIFVAAGLGTAGAGVWNLLAVSRTAYAVTDRRVLVVKEFGARRIQSYHASALNVLERRERADGSGTLTFRRETTRSNDGTSTTNFSFYGVHNVRGAAHALQLLQDAAR